MNYNQAMQFIKQKAEKETDPLLQFLLMPLEDMPDHVTYTAYIYGKFSKKLTRLEKMQEQTKTQMEELKNALVKATAEKINPQTNAPYSIAYAEKVVTGHVKYKHLKNVYLDLKYKALDVKRYLAALDRKVNMTPGHQGAYNKQTEAIENEERD